MQVQCGNCGQAMAITDSQIGCRLHCPKCGISFSVKGDEMLFVCPSCGSLHDNPTNNCSNCGSSMFSRQNGSPTVFQRGFTFLGCSGIFGRILALVSMSLCFYFGVIVVSPYVGFDPFFGHGKYLDAFIEDIENRGAEMGYDIKPDWDPFFEPSVRLAKGEYSVKCPYCHDKNIIRYESKAGVRVMFDKYRKCYVCDKVFVLPDLPNKNEAPWYY